MLFLIFFVPISLLAAYLSFICVRKKASGAALLMGGISVVCLIVSLLILAAGMFVIKVT